MGKDQYTVLIIATAILMFYRVAVFNIIMADVFIFMIHAVLRNQRDNF
jgi:hypothetical protein